MAGRLWSIKSHDLGKEYFDKSQRVQKVDRRTVDAVGSGDVHVNMQFKVSQSKPCVIYHVLHEPELTCNLLSVRASIQYRLKHCLNQTHRIVH